jgi:UDP-glucose 4-epimerase
VTDVRYKGKNVLITGGLGFLGSCLAHELVASGARVTIIDNLNPLYGGNLFNVRDIRNEIEVVVGDLRESGVLASPLERADAIFHLAAQVSYIDSLNIPFEDLDLNAKATLQILEGCRARNRKARIVFSSSRMVYGKVDRPKISEDCPANPLSLYGIHKRASETYLQLYHKNFGIPVTVLRLTNPYGPRQQVKHSKYSLIGWFVRQAMEGKVIRIFGTGHQLRDYIYADDVARAMLGCGAAPEAVGEVINVGSGTSTRFCDMVAAVLRRVGSGGMEFAPWPDNYENLETGDISLDISKLSNITGWRPEISLDEGIGRTHEYYRAHLKEYV